MGFTDVCFESFFSLYHAVDVAFTMHMLCGSVIVLVMFANSFFSVCQSACFPLSLLMFPNKQEQSYKGPLCEHSCSCRWMVSRINVC